MYEHDNRGLQALLDPFPFPVLGNAAPTRAIGGHRLEFHSVLGSVGEAPATQGDMALLTAELSRLAREVSLLRGTWEEPGEPRTATTGTSQPPDRPRLSTPPAPRDTVSTDILRCHVNRTRVMVPRPVTAPAPTNG